MAETVDLVINCWERTYRRVLLPGFFPKIISQNKYAFKNVIALINNVEDLAEAKRMAKDLQMRGEITGYYVVAQELPGSLKKLGLQLNDLQPIPHYSDCTCVSLTLPGSPYVCYWDAEMVLREPIDWITPGVALLTRDSRVVIVSPNWDYAGLLDNAEEVDGDFVLDYGCSDVVFLADRRSLAKPLYKYWCPASLRHPLAHLGAIFEQRLDSYMRRKRKYRATYTKAVYVHDNANLGQSYPQQLRLSQKLRLKFNRTVVALLKKLKSKNPCLKI